MKNDAISRSAAVKEIERIALQVGKDKVRTAARCCSAIELLPSLDVQPVVLGRWEPIGGDEWVCTACGEVITTEGSWEKPTKKYCYECGARMDVEEDT